MKFRIYFRTLRFIAYNWGFPFFVGMATALFIAAWSNTQLLDVMADAFDLAITKACLQ